MAERITQKQTVIDKEQAIIDELSLKVANIDNSNTYGLVLKCKEKQAIIDELTPAISELEAKNIDMIELIDRQKTDKHELAIKCKEKDMVIDELTQLEKRSIEVTQKATHEM